MEAGTFQAHLGRLAGGLGYAVASKATARFDRRLSSDASLRRQLAAIQNQLSKWRDLNLVFHAGLAEGWQGRLRRKHQG
jgi:acetylornithine deacetylase/succinyl-diaminopimelate desuccinylase-like protein